MIPRFHNVHGDERVVSWQSPLPIIEPDPAIAKPNTVQWLRYGTQLTRPDPNEMTFVEAPYVSEDNYINTDDFCYLVYPRTPENNLTRHWYTYFPVLYYDDIDAYGRFHMDFNAYLVYDFNDDSPSNYSKVDSTIFRFDFHFLSFVDSPNTSNGTDYYPAHIPLATTYVSGSPVTSAFPQNAPSLIQLVRERVVLTLPNAESLKNWLFYSFPDTKSNGRYVIAVRPTLINMGHADITGLTVVSPINYAYLEPISPYQTGR